VDIRDAHFLLMYWVWDIQRENRAHEGNGGQVGLRRGQELGSVHKTQKKRPDTQEKVFCLLDQSKLGTLDTG